MRPLFLQNIGNNHLYRFTTYGKFWIGLIIGFLFAAYLLVAYIDTTAEKDQKIVQRETEIIYMLQGHLISLGDGQYTQCYTMTLIPSIVNKGNKS